VVLPAIVVLVSLLGWKRFHVVVLWQREL